MAAYYAVLDPGDTVLGPAARPRRPPHARPQGQLLRPLLPASTATRVRREDGRIDLDEVRALALEHRPKLIVAGGSAYPREIDARAFREIADEAGALLMVDMAHFSGLVAAGLHQNPVESADIVCSTTHKTLAGPRAGFVLCRAGARAEGRPRRLPGPAGRAALPRHGGQGRLLRDRDDRALPRVPARGQGQRGGARRGHRGAGRRAADGRHRHASRAARPAPAARSPGKDMEERLHDILHHRQPQHRARSTSARRPSPRASASARRPRRCAGSTRPTRARSAA